MTGILEKKVIVISGVGPGLGTTLAHRCAKDGAELVLAARTVERLEELARQLGDAGHKALAVRADITSTSACTPPWNKRYLRPRRSTCIHSGSPLRVPRYNGLPNCQRERTA